MYQHIFTGPIKIDQPKKSKNPINIPFNLIWNGLVWVGEKIVDYYYKKKEEREKKRDRKVVEKIEDLNESASSPPYKEWESEILKNGKI